MEYRDCLKIDPKATVGAAELERELARRPVSPPPGVQGGLMNTRGQMGPGGAAVALSEIRAGLLKVMQTQQEQSELVQQHLSAPSPLPSSPPNITPMIQPIVIHSPPATQPDSQLLTTLMLELGELKAKLSTQQPTQTLPVEGGDSAVELQAMRVQLAGLRDQMASVAASVDSRPGGSAGTEDLLRLVGAKINEAARESSQNSSELERKVELLARQVAKDDARAMLVRKFGTSEAESPSSIRRRLDADFSYENFISEVSGITSQFLACRAQFGVDLAATAPGPRPMPPQTKSQKTQALLDPLTQTPDALSLFKRRFGAKFEAFQNSGARLATTRPPSGPSVIRPKKAARIQTAQILRGIPTRPRPVAKDLPFVQCTDDQLGCLFQSPPQAYQLSSPPPVLPPQPAVPDQQPPLDQTRNSMWISGNNYGRESLDEGFNAQDERQPKVSHFAFFKNNASRDSHNSIRPQSPPQPLFESQVSSPANEEISILTPDPNSSVPFEEKQSKGPQKSLLSERDQFKAQKILRSAKSNPSQVSIAESARKIFENQDDFGPSELDRGDILKEVLNEKFDLVMSQLIKRQRADQDRQQAKEQQKLEDDMNIQLLKELKDIGQVRLLKPPNHKALVSRFVPDDPDHTASLIEHYKDKLFNDAIEESFSLQKELKNDAILTKNDFARNSLTSSGKTEREIANVRSIFQID